MGRLFRFVVSGKSVAELKENMEIALNELSGEETTALQEPTRRTATETVELRKQQFEDAPDLSKAIHLEHIPAHFAPVAQPTGVDSMGLPWDERIHSSNMAKTKDGSWRTRRGVEPAYVRQVEHELIDRIKNGGAAQAPTFQAPPAPVAPAPALPPLQPSAPVIPFSPVPMGNVSQQPIPLTVPVVAAAPPLVQPIAPSIATPAAPQPPVTSAHSLQTFSAQFVPTLAALVNEGKLTPEYVAALKNYFKIEQIYDANDAQKAEMFETFCKAGILTKVG